MKRSPDILLVVVAAIVGVALPGTAGARTRLPGQVITVEARTSHSETAVVRIWQLQGNGHYLQIHDAVPAFTGWRGVGPTREGIGRTPVGVFSLTQAFGNEPNDGTRLPYFRAGPDDWWDENPNSPHYNRHVRSRYSPGGDSENLYDAGYVYSHAIVINYNMNPVVKGAGSGFFLHVSGGSPTHGCVSIPASSLAFILRWLKPGLHPVISIGVGYRALAVVNGGPMPVSTTSLTSPTTTLSGLAQDSFSQQ